jgi:hypothetical protein
MGIQGTRMPVATVFENLEAGLTTVEFMEEFSITREQIKLGTAFRGEELGNRPPNRHCDTGQVRNGLRCTAPDPAPVFATLARGAAYDIAT